jgi:hypothetical protein
LVAHAEEAIADDFVALAEQAIITEALILAKGNRSLISGYLYTAFAESDIMQEKTVTGRKKSHIGRKFMLYIFYFGTSPMAVLSRRFFLCC